MPFETTPFPGACRGFVKPVAGRAAAPASGELCLAPPWPSMETREEMPLSATENRAAAASGAPLIEAAALKAMIGDGEELALLDVREEGVFAEAHLFWAASLPLSRLELRLDALVPRRGTRIVLCDEGGGLAERAAAKLGGFGYRDVSVLAGGVGAWAKAGYQLFSGVHVPSKAFGEFVEHEAATPHLAAAEVKALMDQGADLIVLDSRPMDEYRRMSIPRGID